MIKTTHKIVCINVFLFIALGASHSIYAIPLNGLISIPSRSFTARDSLYDDPALSIEFGYDFVLDTTDHEGSVKNGEPIDSKSIKQYEGFHVIADFLIKESLLINLGFWDRRLANKEIL